MQALQTFSGSPCGHIDWQPELSGSAGRSSASSPRVNDSQPANRQHATIAMANTEAGACAAPAGRTGVSGGENLQAELGASRRGRAQQQEHAASVAGVGLRPDMHGPPHLQDDRSRGP